MKGKILRLKKGYNPNSSSMGSIIFALPVSLIVVSFGMAAASSIIFPFFIKEKREETCSDTGEERNANAAGDAASPERNG